MFLLITVEVKEMSITAQDIREMTIDGALETLLEKSRCGAIFNLYDELERMGFSWLEITEAAGRKMARMQKEIDLMTEWLLS